MTHNIVACFSTSIWTNEESERAHSLGFSVGDFKEYPVVSGSVFSEQYNETLDSATIVLSQVFASDRLSYIQPYDFVRVYDKSTYNEDTGKYDFDKIYLLDNYTETENNIKDHIFGYTIHLMSETKILEKIQCPNLTITHEVKNGMTNKKTIYQHIKQYMELYVPKVKFHTTIGDQDYWEYRPLIEIDYGGGTPPRDETVRGSFTGDYTSFSPAGSRRWKVSMSTPISSFVGADASVLDVDSVEITNVTDNGLPSFDILRVTFNKTTKTVNLYGTVLSLDSPEDFWEVIVAFDISYTVGTRSNFSKRFDVTSADLSFNCPTLRQLLTTLMQQVGCIPTVHNRKLGYLDFQKDLVPFGEKEDHSIDYTVDNTVNKITRGLSSDSFVNTLVNISNNVLDSGNEVICETLGFRDRSNFLLKQESNLYLETNFPIYKVTKCILHAPGKYSGYISANYGCSAAYWISQTSDGTSDEKVHYFPFFIYALNSLSDGTATITPSCTFPRDNTNDPNHNYWPTSHTIHIKDNLIYFLGRRNDGSYYIVETKEMEDISLDESNTTHMQWTDSYQFYYSKKEVSISATSSNVVGFFFSGYFQNSNGEKRDFSFIKFDDNDELEFYKANGTVTSESDKAVSASLKLSLAGTRTWDITKLIVESSIRGCLESNFETMLSEIDNITKANTDTLSKYTYGTVGYTIGSTKIEGFSTVFVPGSTTVLGWITKGYTYIENIIKALKNNFEYTNDLLLQYYDFLNYLEITFQTIVESSRSYGMLGGLLVNYQFMYYSPISENFSGDPYFTSMFVDLYYQPLNSFNISYVKSKESIDYPLEQFDGNASGLTDFDRLSIHEQEQVDRVGNETLSINQRTDDFSLIQNFDNGPLYFMDDTNRSGSIGSEDNGVKYTIFKYTYSINNNCFNANYTGSKDAILKDYFTSIRTKYRAYEYVDYNSSVLRKEKDVFYVRVATDYYRGDNRIWWGNYYNKNTNKLSNLIYDISNQSSKPISYECECDQGLYNTEENNETVKRASEQLTKNSVSLITSNNMLGIIYECLDNVGAGSYITNAGKNANLGGVPQSWQLWGDGYNKKHTVTFVNYIDFYSSSVSPEGSAATIYNYVTRVGLVPIVDNSFINIYNSDNVIFSVVDDNRNDHSSSYTGVQRTFYKDGAERINHTVQFIYYAPNNDVLFGEDFISGTPMVSRFNNSFNVVYATNLGDFEFNSNPHSKPTSDTKVKSLDDDGEDFYESYVKIITEDNLPRLRIYWHFYKIVKLCHLSDTGDIIDIAVFKRPGTDVSLLYTDFFFTVNDTKTDYVLDEKDGILYRAYKVTTNNLIRTATPLYVEPEEDS